MITINPKENGIHSLAQALRAFKEFHDNSSDKYALKDSILRSHHALETLFKFPLYLENPVLLVKKDKKVEKILEGYENFRKGKFGTILDELETASLRDTIKRLRRFDLLPFLNQKEYTHFLDSIERLTFWRNRIQHLHLEVDPEIVGRILGNVLPRAIEILKKIPFIDLENGWVSYASIMDDLTKFFPEARSIIQLLRHDYDELIQETIRFFHHNKFEDQILKLVIDSHGLKTPFMPPFLKLEGFLKSEFDSSSDMGWRAHRMLGPRYTANIDITPKLFDSTSPSDVQTVEGTLLFKSKIIQERGTGFLVLPNADDKISELRDITVNIESIINYEADVSIFHGRSINYEKILKADGELNITIAAIPMGFSSEEAEIIGVYKSSLNEKNAPFTFRCFLEPDHSIMDNITASVHWIINSEGDIIFS